MPHPLIAPYVRVSYTALHHYRLKRCFSQYFSGLISAGLFPIFFSSTSGDRRKLTTLIPHCLYNPNLLFATCRICSSDMLHFKQFLNWLRRLYFVLGLFHIFIITTLSLCLIHHLASYPVSVRKLADFSTPLSSPRHLCCRLGVRYIWQ